MTPRCPETGRACSTSYKTYGCRCDACRAWKQGIHAEYVAAKNESRDLDPSMHEGLEALWSEFMDAFMVDLAYAADMMEASVPIANRRGLR